MLSSSSPPRAVDDLSLDLFLHMHWPEQVSDVRRLIDPILSELAVLHKQGQIHGGIQPSALRFLADGTLNRAHFLSFQRREDGSIREEVPHAFRAPETFSEDALDQRVDCYAVGVLLYKILTGSVPPPPSRRFPQDVLLTPERVSKWPASLLDLANRCLALSRDERIANAEEVQAILAQETPIPEGSEKAENDLKSAAPATETASETGTSGGGELPVLPQPVREQESAASQTASMAAEPGADEKSSYASFDEVAGSVRIPSEVSVPAVSEPEPVAAPVLEAAANIPSEPAPSDPPSPEPTPITSAASAVPPALPPQATAPQTSQAALALKEVIVPRLPNASVGKPYLRNVRDLFGDHVSRVTDLVAYLPAGCGLSFDEASAMIQGTPTLAGEFTVGLSFHLASAAPGHSALTHDVAITINPDPTSLWKNTPSDQNGLFAKPDSDAAHLSTPQISSIAASLRGRSHAHEGKYREDDFAMRVVEETGWHCFIVADGAGSAKYSRRGSQLVCATALSKLTQWLSAGNDLDEALQKFGANIDGPGALEKLRGAAYNPLVQAAYEAFLSVRKEVEEHKAALRDFATTFIAVIAKRFEKQWFFASFAIGDGGAGVLVEPGKLQSLTRPDSGEFAGQTVFLTMPQIFQDQAALFARTQVAFCQDFRFLAVMTDGITDPIFKNDAAQSNAEAWEKWEQQLAGAVKMDTLASGEEAALLQWLTFPSPGNHDDRTLILAVPQKTVLSA